MKQIFKIISILLISLNLNAQSDTSKLDNITIKSSYLRISTGYLNGFNSDIGIGRQVNSLLISTQHEGYWYESVYLSNEFILSKNGLIIGPKIGAGYSFQGGAMGGALGLEIIQYSNLKGYNTLSITPKFDIPLFLSSILIVSYGYNIFTNNDYVKGLTHHKIMLTCNLNLRAHKLIREGHRKWKIKYNAH